jgi:hypothetical protein
MLQQPMFISWAWVKMISWHCDYHVGVLTQENKTDDVYAYYKSSAKWGRNYECLCKQEINKIAQTTAR